MAGDKNEGGGTVKRHQLRENHLASQLSPDRSTVQAELSRAVATSKPLRG
jgi:hypothetical protein